MIKAFIFDMDGTLVDSEKYWTLAPRVMLERFGYKLTDDFRKRDQRIGQLIDHPDGYEEVACGKVAPKHEPCGKDQHDEV